MQVWHFTVTVVAIEQDIDEDLVILGLADNADKPEEYLTIQRSFAETDDKDGDLGLDTYSVSLSDGATDYGCIERWTLEPERLQLDFNPASQAVFGLRGIDLRLKIKVEHYQQLQQILEQLLNE